MYIYTFCPRPSNFKKPFLSYKRCEFFENLDKEERIRYSITFGGEIISYA